MSKSMPISDPIIKPKVKSQKQALTKSTSTVGTKAKAIPAYQRIKDSILQNIHSGVWQAGDAIPTEFALADTFGVSRMTVNRALKELSEERVLERRQGSGTFVAQQQFNHTFVEVRNIAEDLKSAHKTYEAKVLSIQRVPFTAIDKKLRTYFQNAVTNEGKNMPVVDGEVDVVKIVHIADGEAMQFEERWVDAQLVPNFIEQDFSVTNTSDYLIAQVPLEGGSYTIKAVAAPAEVAQVLGISEGAPALLLSRKTYSAGQVVTCVNMWHAGNRYQFSGTL